MSRATKPIFKLSASVGRNKPCPCKSGKKFKQCCLPRVNGTQEITQKRLAMESAAPAPVPTEEEPAKDAT